MVADVVWGIQSRVCRWTGLGARVVPADCFSNLSRMGMDVLLLHVYEAKGAPPGCDVVRGAPAQVATEHSLLQRRYGSVYL